MHVLGGAPSWQEACNQRCIRFDAEAFKRAVDHMMDEAAVQLLLHTLVADVMAEGGRTKGLLVESESGRQAVMGKVIIDATGDADVAFRAGAERHQGPDFDRRVQAMGSFLHLGVCRLSKEGEYCAVDRLQPCGQRAVHFLARHDRAVEFDLGTARKGTQEWQEPSCP